MKIQRALAILVLMIVGTFFLNESFIYSQNCILINPFWNSFKAGFFNPIPGGIESLVARSLIAQNKLQTNINLGHQLILTKSAQLPSSLQYDVTIKPEGYIDIVFNFQKNQFEGIRLGRSSLYENIYYQSERNGRFLSTHPLSPLPSNTDHFKLELHQKNDHQLILLINKSTSIEIPSQFKMGQLGFYTSLDNLTIHEVHLRDSDGLSHHLDFSSPTPRLQNFFKNLVLFILLTLILGFFLKKMSDNNTDSSILKSSLCLCLLSMMWFSFDFFYYSKLIRYWDFTNYYFKNPYAEVVDLEQFRYRFFRKWNTLFGGEPISEKLLFAHNIHYQHNPGIRVCQISTCQFEKPPIPIVDKNIKNVLYFGASFAQNAGIEQIEDAYFDIFGQNLGQYFKNSKQAFRIYNFSYPGDYFIDKKEEILSLIQKFKASEVIIGIYIRPEDFKSFYSLVETLNKQGIYPLYLVPITNPESPNSHYFQSSLGPVERLTYIKSLPEDEKTSDLYIEELSLLGKISFFNNNSLGTSIDFNRQGILWWDSGHMSAFGQRLLATQNSKFFIDLLETKKKGKL